MSYASQWKTEKRRKKIDDFKQYGISDERSHGLDSISEFEQQTITNSCY